MDYEFKDYQAADVVKVRHLAQRRARVDALSIIVHRCKAPTVAERWWQNARGD